VAKAEWGTKRTCQHCGARFYDLRRSPPTCPACGAAQAPEAPSRSSAAKAARKAAPGPSPMAADDGDDLDGDVGDDELIEDASELGEDEEDMSEVLPVEDETEKEP